MQKKLRDIIRWEIWPRDWTGLVPYPQIFTGYSVLAGLFPGVVSIYAVSLNITKYLSTEDDRASPFLLLTKIELFWLVESFRWGGTWGGGKGPQDSSWWPPSRWWVAVRCPQSHLFSRPNKPSSLSTSSRGKCPQPSGWPSAEFVPIYWCLSCVSGSSKLDPVCYVV